jgi:hypothetical protein
MRFVTVSERILLTLWVGGLWSIGYMAIPTLFNVLDDHKLAGDLAGEMFHIISYIGFVCGTLLLVSTVSRAGKIWQFWVIVTMLVLAGCSEFLLQPIMHELKLVGLVEGSEQLTSFRRYHGISQVLYLVNSLMGLALIVFGLNRHGDIAL